MQITGGSSYIEIIWRSERCGCTPSLLGEAPQLKEFLYLVYKVGLLPDAKDYGRQDAVETYSETVIREIVPSDTMFVRVPRSYSPLRDQVCALANQNVRKMLSVQTRDDVVKIHEDRRRKQREASPMLSDQSGKKVWYEFTAV